MAKLGLFRFSGEAKTVAAGETIFRQGDPGDYMYIVQEGDAEIRIGDSVISRIGTDEFFGEMALLNDTPRSATAVAVSDCKLIPIDQKRFTFLIQETPFFAIEVMRVMAVRLQDATEKAIAG